MIDATPKPLGQNEIIHPESYFVKFTGDYSQLKYLGYSFQKLYAANYLQWNKGDLSVWKKGHDVTHDSLGDRFPAVLNMLLKMGINDLPFKLSSHFNINLLRLYINKVTYECTSDHSMYKQDRKRLFETLKKINEEEEQGLESTTEMYIEEWTVVCFTPESVEPLRELAAKGWIKLQKRGQEGAHDQG